MALQPESTTTTAARPARYRSRSPRVDVGAGSAALIPRLQGFGDRSNYNSSPKEGLEQVPASALSLSSSSSSPSSPPPPSPSSASSASPVPETTAVIAASINNTRAATSTAHSQRRQQQPTRSSPAKESLVPIYAHQNSAVNPAVTGIPAATASGTTPPPKKTDSIAASTPLPLSPHWVPQPPNQLRLSHSRSFSASQLLHLSPAQASMSTVADHQRTKSLLASARFGDTGAGARSQPDIISAAQPETGKKGKTIAIDKGKGMRRISKFFRGTSATPTPHDQSEGKPSNKDTSTTGGLKPSQNHKLGHKGMSKSTGHLPLVLPHVHPHPAPPPLPPSQQPLLAMATPRRAVTSDDLGAASSKLPVTNDGVSIPPMLEEVDIDGVATLDAVEPPGGSGAPKSGYSVMQVGDPGKGGVMVSPPPVMAYDEQRDTRPKFVGQAAQEQPVTPSPNPPYTFTSRPATPPTTTTSDKPHRKHLSMAFMNKSKKPQSRDSDTLTKAWKLSVASEADSEDYDLSSLNSGDEVSDLWDPRGDTLVYLSAPPLPGQSDGKARFRISSSPLMFAALKGYVVEVAGGGGIESIEEEPSMGGLGPEDLFLSIPANPEEEGGQGLGDWGKLDDMTGDQARLRGAKAGESGRESVSPEPYSSTSGETEGQRFTFPPPSRPPPPPPPQTHETYAVRYKLYYSRVAQEARSDYGDCKSTNIIRILDARNLFAFLDKKFLVASLERINAFRILEKLYLQLFIEPSISSPRPRSTSPSGSGSPPGSPRLGPAGRFRRGTGGGGGGGVTPPRTPNSLPGTAGMGQNQLIDDLPAKVMLAGPHLEYYIGELKLDDIRALPADSEADAEKPRGGFRDSMEAMYLGEKWRNSHLFLEGYLHTVGRWEEIKQSRHPLVEFLTPMTLAKLDRAALDLENREREVHERFTGMGGAGEFVFPAMFTGVGKYPRFKRWREGFVDSRELVVRHLKWVYGSWPPRAGRKGKGGGSGGERGGLNREVLRRVERDVGMLWEVVVDWGRPRYPPGGFAAEDGEEEGLGDGLWKVEGFGRKEEEEEVSVEEDQEEQEGENELRTLLEEFDRASPPVQPRPMFDVPRLPKLPGQARTPKKSGGKKDKQPKSKKVKGENIMKALESSWNNLLPSTLPPSTTDTATELVNKFKEMELDFAQNKVLGSTQGRTIEDLQEYRKGCWVFIYAVLQSLPMLVVDAPIVRWSEGCEYFLCVGWKHPVLPWEDRDGVMPRVRGPRAAQLGNGNKRASVMWASAPGGTASLLPPGIIGGDLNLSDLALAAGVLPEAGGEEDEVGAAYHRSYCWVRAAGWCVKWEEEKRRRREEELRRVLERGGGKWEGGGGDRLAVGTSDYGSGEGSVAVSIVREGEGEAETEGGKRTPMQGTPRRGSPLHMQSQQQVYLGHNQGQQYLSQQYHSYPSVGIGTGMGLGAPREEQRTSSLESRSAWSVGSSGSGSGGGDGGPVSAGRRTPNALTHVDDIPKVLLPGTRDRRMSSFGGGNWGGAGMGIGQG